MEQNLATKADIQMIFELIKEFKDDTYRRFEQMELAR